MPILKEPLYLSRPSSAAQAVRDAIISGELKSGERLVELQLASRFKIGQPTVREALKELEYQGFVHKIATRGTYVTDFSAADFHKIHEARMALEPLAFERAARNMTPEAAAALAATVRAMAEAVARTTVLLFTATTSSFTGRSGGSPGMSISRWRSSDSSSRCSRLSCPGSMRPSSSVQSGSTGGTWPVWSQAIPGRREGLLSKVLQPFGESIIGLN